MPRRPQIPVTRIAMDEVIKDARYSLPIAELELPHRVHYALMKENIEFTGQLVQLSINGILRLPNCASKSLHDVVSALAANGLKLNTAIIDKPENETEFADILRKNKGVALAQNTAVVPPDASTLAAIEPVVAESRKQAFQTAGQMLLEVARDLNRGQFKFAEDTDTGSLPDSLVVLAKAINDVRNQGFQDAARLMSALGERFSSPAFQKILMDGIERHDRKRSAETGAPTSGVA